MTRNRALEVDEVRHVITPNLVKELQAIRGKLREADRLVVSELNLSNYSHDDVEMMDRSYTKYYHAIEEIQHELDLLLDRLMK